MTANSPVLKQIAGLVPLAHGLCQAGRCVRAEQKSTFVSVTQSFCTTTSVGRLTLNILLSFAQFERELAGERIRDKTKLP